MDFAQQQRNPTRHLVSVGGVLLLHALIIWALVTGLARKVVEVVKGPIDVKVIEEVIKKPPPPPEVIPPPPKMQAPPPPFVPPPEINIATDAPATNAITAVQSVQPTAPAPIVAAPTPPKAVGRTHNCDSYYPDLSRRLNEQGTVIVQYVVGVDGTIANVAVKTTSGSDRLDQAAVSCVSSKWRSEPATQGGKPVAVTVAAAVKFNIK